ncbi:MAG: BolA family transcriptional regulator [Ahniella sp.]|nr:BolA family transcriptional regulator [Ahniella sp.]
MRAKLTEALAPTTLDIIDDSHKHVGHAGARDGRGHFTVHVTSSAFAGLSLLARHRAIYAALGGMMDTDIHALAIKADVPDPMSECWIPFLWERL